MRLIDSILQTLFYYFQVEVGADMIIIFTITDIYYLVINLYHDSGLFFLNISVTSSTLVASIFPHADQWRSQDFLKRKSKFFEQGR